MEESVEQLLHDAWAKVRPKLLGHVEEVRRRLERGRRMWARRPPRAWCLAVRASDARINPATALCDPPDAAYPREATESGVDAYARHTVTLEVELLRRLCAPVEVAGFHKVREVTRKLGRGGITGRDALLATRALGVFVHNHVPPTAYRGKPKPLILSRTMLDPGQRLLAPADRVWDWTGPLWPFRVPDDLPAQDIVRIPIYYDRNQPYRYDADELHPEHPQRDPAPSRNPRRRLPPAPPDFVWYKWKGDQYVGYDWRWAQTNPLVREDYERHERAKAMRRAAAKRRRREGRLTPSERAAAESHRRGSLLFRGWRWLCPLCERRIKVIFYPLPPINLLRGYGCLIPDPLIDEPEKLCVPLDSIRRASGFACDLCHGVRPFSRADRNGWNETVCYLSGGLLYGSEVQRPSWLTPDRKRPYRPIPSRAPSERRAQVQERLLADWSYKQIAADLKLAEGTIMGYASRVYAQHQVHSREELARKLGVTLSARREDSRETSPNSK